MGAVDTLRDRATVGSEATQQDVQEGAVHRLAHHVGEERTGGTDQRTGDDQQRVLQHQTGEGSCPAGVGVHDGHDDRHVAAADSGDQVPAHEQGQGGHDANRDPGAGALTREDEHDHENEADHQDGDVQQVAGRQQQRGALDLAGELQASEDRAGEGHGTDEDAEEDLTQVEVVGGSAHRVGGLGDEGVVADEDRAQTDQAVEQCDQLRQTSHLDGVRALDAVGGTEAHSQGDEDDGDDRVQSLGIGRGMHHGLEDGHGDGNSHTAHTQRVTALCGFRLREAGQCHEEEHGGHDVGQVRDPGQPVQQRGMLAGRCLRKNQSGSHGLCILLNEHAEHAVCDGEATEHVDGGHDDRQEREDRNDDIGAVDLQDRADQDDS